MFSKHTFFSFKKKILYIFIKMSTTTLAVKNEIPELVLGAVIDIPTGRIAQQLGLETPIIEKALCWGVSSSRRFLLASP